MAATGANAGCTPVLNLYGSGSFTIRVYSFNTVGTNYVDVRVNSGGTYAQVAYDLSTSFVPPTSSLTTPYTRTYSTPLHQTWRIAAAASHALYRHNGGLSGETFLFHNNPSDTGGSSWDRDDEWINIGTNGNRKYVIIHEMGHAMGHYLNGGASPNHDYGASVDDCYTVSARAHEMNSKEYQSSAAWEGWAHFYAALAFNVDTSTSSDCWFEYYKTVDWDLSGFVDDQTANCEGSPLTGVPSEDYIGGVCANLPAGLPNRGTEYDWLRFWWDLRTDQSLSYATIGSIWNASNPDTWTASGDSSGGRYPAARLRSAASGQGVLTEWDAEDNANGVHR